MQVTLAATNATLFLSCQKTTLTIHQRLTKRLSTSLVRLLAHAEAGKFHELAIEHFRLFSGPNTIALADTLQHKVIFLSGDGAKNLLLHIGRYSQLATLLTGAPNTKRLN